MTRVLASGLAAMVCAAGIAAFGASSARAQGGDVTLRLERFYDNACRCYKLRFSGTIASRAANEYVAVLQQKCGSSSATAIAGGSTREGGVWEAEPVTGGAPGSDSSTYRARWNGRLSEPLTFRANVPISITQLSSGRYRVTVTTGDIRQSLKGRVVELQRMAGGRWTRVRRLRLAPEAGSAGTRFSATFRMRARGVTVRLLVPAESASPCHTATASRPWVSGRRPGGGSGASARVIDRTLLCPTAMQGGVRLASIRASEGVQTGPAQPGTSFDVTTNFVPDGRLVSATTNSLELNATRCTSTRARVQLTARGLDGGRPGVSGQEFECETPRRVLVRVRAVFRSATRLERSRPWGYPVLTALGQLKEASVAMRTQAGKPLSFASIHESGRARLLSAPSCVEDTTTP
jgi:hypothetical protein